MSNTSGASPSPGTGTVQAPPSRPGTRLELAVRYTASDRGFELEFTLDCDVPGEGFRRASMGTRSLARDPEGYCRRFVEQIRDLSSKRPETSEIQLGTQGHDLFQKLLPMRLRRELHRWRGRVHSLHIVSNERWIPWEALHLGDNEGETGSGSFLAEAYRVTRGWQGELASLGLTLHNLAVITAEDSGLPGVDEERRFFMGLGHSGRRVREIRPELLQVLTNLRMADFDVLHFVGHSQDAEHADQFYLSLNGRDSLRVAHLSGAGDLRDTRPLVFLNACAAAAGRLSITGLDGWVEAFLSKGAGAFLGPLWKVRNGPAQLFARVFYRELYAGRTLGDAVFQARQAVKRKFRGDPAWLAYVAYAPPETRYRSSIEESDESVEVSPPSAPAEPILTESRMPPGEEIAGEESEERVHPRDGTVLLPVPEGVYRLGDCRIDLQTHREHSVRLSAFWIAKFPVTNEQYERFLADHNDHAPPPFWQDEGFDDPRQPVVGVSWQDAQAYCRWAGLKLPTEAQWEAAARGPAAWPYPWGGDLPTPERANYGGQVGGPTAVDAYPEGRGPFGTFDLAGNVWEWCADSWSLTAYQERVDGESDPWRGGTSPRICVVRGGSWQNPAGDLKAAQRNRATASMRMTDQGFRCAL